MYSIIGFTQRWFQGILSISGFRLRERYLCVYIIAACAAIGQSCANGRCFLPWESCDGVNDCGDYSDEINCSMFMP